MSRPAWAPLPARIKAQHPDEFADDLFDLHPAAVVEAARRQRASLRIPPMEVNRYLDTTCCAKA